jgi:hypothetical protein
MPSLNNTAGGWSDHRLRQISNAARFIASVLEEPHHALVSADVWKQFREDVVSLQNWLEPCEALSANQQASPPSIGPALLDTLFSLQSTLSRLQLASVCKTPDPTLPGLYLEIMLAKPLRQQFADAVKRLFDLMADRASALVPASRQAESGPPSPRLVVRLDSQSATLDGETYGSLDPEAARILHALLAADGRPVTANSLRSLPALKGKRIDRCCKKLPVPLRQLVQPG